MNKENIVLNVEKVFFFEELPPHSLPSLLLSIVFVY